VPKRRHVPVVITAHARERYQERGGKERLSPAKMRRHILGALAEKRKIKEA